MTKSAHRFVQVYTGDGKGKTTAAIGLAVRAAGCGLRTLLIMFMKEFPYSEIESLHHLSEWITVEQYGNDEFVLRRQPPSTADRDVARKALSRARQGMLNGDYDIIVLDEICVAAHFGLVAVDELLPTLDERPESVELILTGRYCPPEWIERADLVTEMKDIKHYYRQGILARKGFES